MSVRPSVSPPRRCRSCCALCRRRGGGVCVCVAAARRQGAPAACAPAGGVMAPPGGRGRRRERRPWPPARCCAPTREVRGTVGSPHAKGGLRRYRWRARGRRIAATAPGSCRNLQFALGFVSTRGNGAVQHPGVDRLCRFVSWKAQLTSQTAFLNAGNKKGERGSLRFSSFLS